MNTKKTILLVATGLVIGSLACNLTAGSDGSPAPESPPDTQEASQAEQTPETEAEPQTQPDSSSGGSEDALPVPINEGLASLNSYRMTNRMESTGPTEVDRSSSLMLMEHDEQADATHIRSDSTTHDEDDPEGRSETTDYYQIGNENCTISDGEAEFESMSPIEREMTDLMASMFDLRPSIEEPVQAGEASVNGVETWHYEFELSSLGSSGIEVVRLDGEYWLAKDGRYLVRYLLNLDLRDAPEGTEGAEALVATIEVELTDINTPVPINFPQVCLDAQSAAGAG